MHMNSVPQYLSNEDRQEYERILDEALRSAPHRPELAAVGQRLNAEQLRTMALNATALISAAATTEYQHYVKVREELRHPASSAPSSSAHETDSEQPGTGAVRLAATMGEVAETTGAGAVAVVAVLAPVLAGTAAAIFLLVGYILKMLDPGQTFAQTMLTTGWVFGAVTAVAILVAGVGLLLTALRNPLRRVRPLRRTRRGGDPGPGRLARGPAGTRHPALPAGGPRGPRCGGRPASVGTGDADQPDAPPRLRPPRIHQPRRRPERRVTPELLEPGLQQPGLRRPGTPPGVVTGRGGQRITGCPPGRRQ